MAPRSLAARRLAVFAPAVIVFVVGMLSFSAVRRGAASRQRVFHSREVLDASTRLLTALLDAETAQRGFILAHDTAFLKPYRDAPARVDSMLARLRGLTADNGLQQARLDTLSAFAHIRVALIDSSLSAVRRGQSAEAARIVATGPGTRLMIDVRRLIDEIESEEERLLREREVAAARAARIAYALLVVGTLLAALLALAVNRGFDRALEDRRRALAEVEAANVRLREQAVELTRLFDGERNARTAAEAANRAKAAFLASMSHELRTPLQAALGFAQLVRSGLYGPVNEQQSEILGRVERSQTHLTRLIDDILDFARLEAGHVRMDVERIPLHDVIAELAPLVEPQAGKKHIELSLRRPPHELTVRADKQRLKQILVNLVGNAIQFTADGGKIEVDAIGDGDRASITVRDSGVGIPPDRLGAIFEPFVQVDNGHTRAHPGVGLGLSISRDLARAMGGDLTVESTLGKGSTFSVVLPLG